MSYVFWGPCPLFWSWYMVTLMVWMTTIHNKRIPPPFLTNAEEVPFVDNNKKKSCIFFKRKVNILGFFISSFISLPFRTNFPVAQESHHEALNIFHVSSVCATFVFTPLTGFSSNSWTHHCSIFLLVVTEVA